MKLATGALAALCLLVLTATPTLAGYGDGHGGDGGGSGYNAWAFYARATGGGGIATPETCTLSTPEVADKPAHLEYNVISYDGGATYRIWYDCVLDGSVLEDADNQFPPGSEWDNIDYWDVTPADPAVMVDEVLNRLNPVPPAIATDPGNGVPSLVGLDTYLDFAATLGRQTAPPMEDGPIRVEIWADPVGEVVWDTGDGLPACNAPSAGHACAHNYARSSFGGGYSDTAGRPAYRVAANITYQGGYAVYALGAYVGGSDNIGLIYRTSETFLAVQEAQAINKVMK